MTNTEIPATFSARFDAAFPSALDAYSPADPSTWAARDAIIAQRDADQLSVLVSEMIRDNNRVMWAQIFGIVVSLVALLYVLI